ncbi:hypothetical protein SprV_0802510300 [Sparganum proliferum]
MRRVERGNDQRDIIIFERQLKGVLDHLKSIKAFTLACEQTEKSQTGEEKDRLSESMLHLANLSSEIALKTAAWLSAATSGEETNVAIHNFPSFAQDIQCSGSCDMDETQLIAEAPVPFPGSTSGLTTILGTLCILDGEIKRLPLLIEESRRTYREKLTALCESLMEKLLSETIERCLSVAKQKIDILMNFVTEEVLES